MPELHVSGRSSEDETHEADVHGLVHSKGPVWLSTVTGGEDRGRWVREVAGARVQDFLGRYKNVGFDSEGPEKSLEGFEQKVT
jgi:hypothetical protein